MRVAQVVSTYPPYQGGMGNVAAAFAAATLEHAIVSQVFTPDYGQKGVGEEVHLVKPVFTFGNAALLPHLGKAVAEFDVVHLHYPFFGGAEAVAWRMARRRRRTRQRLVITYHMDTVGRGLKGIVFWLYRHLFLKRIIRTADVVTVSSLDYAHSSALAPFLSALNVKELPFGVDALFKPISRGGLAQSGRVSLLFVGALDKAHYFKGLDGLLDAVAAAIQAGTPVHLTVVGDGDQRAVYEARAQKLGLGNNVVFAGRVSREALVAAYQNADATVLPSIDRSEAFGLVLQESLACGTPVIASDLPGVRTVFENEISGFTVPVGNVAALSAALRRVWVERDRLPAMREAASRRADALYRWPLIGRRLADIYRGD